MKTHIALAFLFLCTPYSFAQQCMYCKYRPLTDTYNCVGTCTSSGQGCSGCCHRLEGGQVCWVGGCCIIIPGVGGTCYDQTGDSCGNFSCTVGTASPLQQSMASSVQQVDAEPRIKLNTVSWITNAKFPAELGRFSQSFEKAMAAFQLVMKNSPEQSAKEYDVRTFNVVARPGFPVKVTVTHATADKWVMYLDRADTEKEGVHAPIMLEIIGNHWTLISHDIFHDKDKSENFVVGSGVIE